MKPGAIVAGTFKERVTAQEIVELIKLLGHIHARANECIGHLDMSDDERARFYRGVEYTSEALRVVLEEVKKNVR